MQGKNQASVKKRLLALAVLKEVNGIRGLAHFLDVPETRLYTWIKRNEIVDPELILGRIPEADQKWLETGVGEPFPSLQTTENTSEFQTRKKEKDSSEELSAMTRLRFKMQCGSAYFDEFFDFIADEYGENREGAELFLQWVHDHHADYRRWLDEKKHGAEGGSDKLPIAKSANGKA